MWTNPQCPADLVTLTEEILNEELHFLCSVTSTTLPGDCLWNISFLILITNSMIHSYRSRHPEVFLGKSVLKICNKFTEEHPCRSVILIKLLCNFIEIAFWHECSPVNFLQIFRTPFPINTSGRLLLFLAHLG